MTASSTSIVGTRHRVLIAEVAFGGDGVARLEDGRVVFVPFVAEGEEVVIEIVGVRKNFLQGRALEIVTPSPERVEAPCVVFGKCGGCRYQHVRYATQLAWKERQVAAALRRVGRFSPESAPVQPILASPLEYAYRNRITVHLVDGAVGFHAARTQRLVEVSRCEIAQPDVNALLAALAANRRRKREDGHRTLRTDRGRRFFHQANDACAEVLLQSVVTFAGAGGSLVDAYCGAGWFIKTLRDRFAHCIGLEWDHYAVEAARADAGPNERYLEGDVALLLPQALEHTARENTTLILDPPAEGLATAATDAIADVRPKRTIYVSCHPATLARDLSRLTRSGGLRIVSVTPIDMFPQTAEIEAVAVLDAV